MMMFNNNSNATHFANTTAYHGHNHQPHEYVDLQQQQHLPCHYGMNCRNLQHRQCAIQYNFDAAAQKEYELYLRRFREYEFECIQYHHTVNKMWRDITDDMVKTAYLRVYNNNNNTTTISTNNNNNINRNHKHKNHGQGKYVGGGGCAELSYPSSQGSAAAAAATSGIGHQLAHYPPQQQRRLW
eukprot:TRINITY_DN11078_c0_g2_i2.p1 TRINITY_DN11078_c0_g2~~TRINITY_DN11078_c0_g2_i2.p1  ORF type:complete len:184 (-),score=40.63 TRINITY_DN11078_c0_g2_i2:670-1221(-)